MENRGVTELNAPLVSWYILRHSQARWDIISALLDMKKQWLVRPELVNPTEETNTNGLYSTHSVSHYTTLMNMGLEHKANGELNDFSSSSALNGTTPLTEGGDCQSEDVGLNWPTMKCLITNLWIGTLLLHVHNLTRVIYEIFDAKTKNTYNYTIINLTVAVLPVSVATNKESLFNLPFYVY